jgi:hypothetical protein
MWQLVPLKSTDRSSVDRNEFDEVDVISLCLCHDRRLDFGTVAYEPHGPLHRLCFRPVHGTFDFRSGFESLALASERVAAVRDFSIFVRIGALRLQINRS